MFLKIVPSGALRRGIRDLLAGPSFRYVRAYYAGLGSCLLYHRVTVAEGVSRSPYGGLAVSASRFAEQMRYLSDHFECLHVGELVARLRRGALKPHSVAVTFDDGYRDNLEVAVPILERFRVPATVFVSTGPIDSGRGLWWYDLERLLDRLAGIDAMWRGERFRYPLGTAVERLQTALALNERLKTLDPESQRSLLRKLGGAQFEEGDYRTEMLTWEQLGVLADNPLITIGAHTVRHPVLSSLSAGELERELVDSRALLEERLGRAITLFAYPYGGTAQASRREFRAAEEAGFAASFTTRFGHIQAGHRHELHAIPRISIDATDDLALFARKLSGLIAFVAQRGRRLVTE